MAKKGLKRLKIFEKAYNMHHGGYIVKDSESENRIYYNVEDPISSKIHLVSIEFDTETQTIKMKCDCTIQALKCKHLPACSHMMTAIVRSVFDLGRPRKRGD